MGYTFPFRPEKIYDAIAHPTRRAILERLEKRFASAGHIARQFDMSRPAVAKHLRVLKEAGLVRQRRLGRLSVYRIVPRGLHPVAQWLAQFRT